MGWRILVNLIIETLHFGDYNISEEQNAQIFKSVQLYIKQRKRFYLTVITYHILNLAIFFVNFFSPLLSFYQEYDNYALLLKDITQYII